MTATSALRRRVEQALRQVRIERDVVLELPGFLGLGAIVQTTDLITTLPRHIGQTLAQVSDLASHVSRACKARARL